MQQQLDTSVVGKQLLGTGRGHGQSLFPESGNAVLLHRQWSPKGEGRGSASPAYLPRGTNPGPEHVNKDRTTEAGSRPAQ